MKESIALCRNFELVHFEDSARIGPCAMHAAERVPDISSAKVRVFYPMELGNCGANANLEVRPGR